MGCSHAASVWPAGESTEWVADEEAEELAGQDEDEGVKLTAFNMAEERADGYFDEVHVACQLVLGRRCRRAAWGGRLHSVKQWERCAALGTMLALLCGALLPRLGWQHKSCACVQGGHYVENKKDDEEEKDAWLASGEGGEGAHRTT